MKKILTIALSAMLFMGCGKDFLDERPDKGLLVPTKLEDFRALMDNTSVMNVVPALQRIACDDLVATDAGVASLSPVSRNSYFWEKDVFAGEACIDWETPYKQVFYANIVLDGLDDMHSGADVQESQWLRGTAHFFRGFAFFHLSQLFAPPYRMATAARELGLPLPLVADVNRKMSRSTLEQTYLQVIADLLAAEKYLPENVAYKSRPNKTAARALLARTYLIMGKYQEAESYAKAVLDVNDKLLDYNTLSTTSSTPYPQALPNGNDEVIFNAIVVAYAFASSAQVGHSQQLYQSYGSNDLRKPLFFTVNANNVVRPKNSYAGSSGTFAGIANDEIYLIYAECLARRQEVSSSMQVLDRLLAKRWKTGTFTPTVVAGPQEALDKVIAERRKELVTNKGVLRWSDLRRLNTDPRYALTITRSHGGMTRSLLPDDRRYTFPIPDNEIYANGMVQNER